MILNVLSGQPDILVYEMDIIFIKLFSMNFTINHSSKLWKVKSMFK